MKKIKKIFAFLLVLVGFSILASCGEEYNFVGEITKINVTDTTAYVEVEFDEHEKLTEGVATPFIKFYNDKGVYVSFGALTFSNSSKVIASANVKDLQKNSEYRFDLVVTYDGKDYLLDQEEVKTKDYDVENGDVVSISTAADFLAMAENRKGKFKLVNDIDFTGDSKDLYGLKNLFTEDKPFEGEFDGSGFTISNFKFTTTSSTVVGVFGATDGATIKNLNISGAEVSFTYGKNGNVGILAGILRDTVVENVNIVDSIFELRTSTSTTTVGSIAGLSANSTVKNVNVNVDMNLTRVRGAAVAGLALGKVEGAGKESIEATDNSVAVKNVYAKGILKAHGYINSSSNESSIQLGGFVGCISTKSNAVIAECATDVIVTYTKETSDSYNNYRLYLGGFAGATLGGSANVKDCVAIADINVYAGATPSNEEGIAALREKALVADKYEDDKEEILIDNFAYISGFVAYTTNYVNTINNCAYVAKDKGILVIAKASDIVVSSTIAKNLSSAEAMQNVYVYGEELLDVDAITKEESTISNSLDFNETINEMISNKNVTEDESDNNVTE